MQGNKERDRMTINRADLPMEMTSLNISLPKPMKAYIESRVKAGAFSTPSEYVRALIRDEQQRLDEAKLEALLLEALESDEPMVEITPDYWEKKRQALMQRLRERPRAQTTDS
jgi:antitoxin ParD1/3/4